MTRLADFSNIAFPESFRGKITNRNKSTFLTKWTQSGDKYSNKQEETHQIDKTLDFAEAFIPTKTKKNHQ